jgi:hypothetical protein
MKIILIYLCIFLSFESFAQNDTITYNDVTILIKNKKRTVYFNDKPYTGIIRQNINNEKICYEYLKKGVSIRKKCINIFKDESENKETLINFNEYKENNAINFNVLKIEKKIENSLIEEVEEDFIEDIYLQDKKVFTGYARKKDTLLFIYKGSLRLSKHFHSNGNVKEIFEYRYGKKNGKYEKYNLDSKKLELGNYLNNLKSGKWEYYYNLEYDCVIDNYKNGEKDGVSFFYKNKHLVRCEFYKYGVLDYYYNAEFNKNKEIREFFRNNKKYAIVTYIDGYIYEYLDVKD